MLPSSQPEKTKEPLPDKLLRKCKEQPLVPLGATLTVSALYLSARALRARNSSLANRMFYWRVGFQAFTVAALIGGAFYYGEGGRKKEKSRDEKLREIAKAREKLWIEELERIEAEAQKVREQADKIKLELGQDQTSK